MSKVLEEYKQLCRELNEFEKNKIPLCARPFQVLCKR